MSRLVKRSAVRAFEVFGALAVALNTIAAAVEIRNDAWGLALGYLVIASMLAGALALHWYVAHRQVPYRWRDEGWGLERWREGRAEETPDADAYGDEVWRDGADEADRD